ncbi:YciI family protein [Kiloniella laminariae]|uniref:YciI family protein n=1 Tax=Kiloniella laminariae TaxID=454162 RepID=A0ABT4LEZ7_9PROT|nr:YciI family protein [Kiloniella laminariae]MCZ4279683.1 YciI family protein [Kiloniella laminariae]
MTRWAVLFTDSPEMLDVRADKARRDAHVAYVRAHPELLIGGGLKTNPEGDFCGALWIVEAAAREDVVQLILRDPFYSSEYRRYVIYSWGKILEDKQVLL